MVQSCHTPTWSRWFEAHENGVKREWFTTALVTHEVIFGGTNIHTIHESQLFEDSSDCQGLDPWPWLMMRQWWQIDFDHLVIVKISVTESRNSTNWPFSWKRSEAHWPWHFAKKTKRLPFATEKSPGQPIFTSNWSNICWGTGMLHGSDLLFQLVDEYRDCSWISSDNWCGDDCWKGELPDRWISTLDFGYVHNYGK